MIEGRRTLREQHGKHCYPARRCVAFELDAEFAEIARARLAEALGRGGFRTKEGE